MVQIRSGGTVMRMKITLALAFGFCLFGCSQIDGGSDENTLEKERWDSRNDPTRFRGLELKYELDDLPMEGRAEREIWPSTYWATYKDSINVRWASNELSPAEKYDQAFNGWTPEEGFMELRPYQQGSGCEEFDKAYYTKLGPLANHISSRMGNAKARDGIDNDGDGEIDECDDRDGVETWFGLCHAWVPAAMLEDRPLRSVEYNGVTFHVGDIEALIIAAYNRVSADMIGGRCNDKGTEVKRDEQGRAEDVACRDTNAGTLHVIMTNYLGLNRTAFAEDKTFDYEVWNQPVVEYKVHSMEEITATVANEKLGLEGDTYEITPDAAILYDVSASVTYITESEASRTPADASRFERTDRYTYILELDSERKIIGGEWYGSSTTKHPDFLWSPRRAYSSSVPHLNIENVRELIRLSREPEMPNALSEPLDFSVEESIEIPDGDEHGLNIELIVPEGIKGEFVVDFILDHSAHEQLKLGLLSPSGESWEIVPAGTHTGSGSLDGVYFPQPEPVGSLAGTWKLVVTDITPGSSGTIEQYGLTITPN